MKKLVITVVCLGLLVAALKMIAGDLCDPGMPHDAYNECVNG